MAITNPEHLGLNHIFSSKITMENICLYECNQNQRKKNFQFRLATRRTMYDFKASCFPNFAFIQKVNVSFPGADLVLV